MSEHTRGKLRLAIIDQMKCALAWGFTYGPVVRNCWDEQRDAMAALFADEALKSIDIPDPESLRRERDELLLAIALIRDAVLHGRSQMAENGMSSDQVNDVLGVIDDNIPSGVTLPEV